MYFPKLSKFIALALGAICIRLILNHTHAKLGRQPHTFWQQHMMYQHTQQQDFFFQSNWKSDGTMRKSNMPKESQKINTVIYALKKRCCCAGINSRARVLFFFSAWVLTGQKQQQPTYTSSISPSLGLIPFTSTIMEFTEYATKEIGNLFNPSFIE